MQIRRANIQDIPAIQQMAEVVFRATYADILSPEQMEYMMQWMYGTDSLVEQITAPGKDFFMAEEDGAPCGYVSIETDGETDDRRPLYHLQKLYVMPQTQGTGLGKTLFDFVKQLLHERHPGGYRIELNVNRDNRAVGFYERMGMRRDRQGDFPIGHGYYMNDYIYTLDINPKHITN